jgi:hypothetical protein
MAINRELSQFGRLVEITDGEHIGIGTTSSVNIGFGTITATTVTATSFYGDGSNLTGVSGGGGDVVDDTTPQLGGNLDLNSNDITGTGNIDITGTLNVTGVSTFQGNVDLGDDDRLRLGDSNDLQIGHVSNVSTINDVGSGGLYVQSNGDGIFLRKYGGEKMGEFFTDGAVELYYDNDLHFATTSDGCKTNGDLSFRGDGDVEQILFDASDASLKFTDSKKAKFGTDEDLQIYHDGSNSYVKENGTGNLKLLGNNLVLKNSADGETYVECANNGAVSLYYDNSKKFETTSSGVVVTGICTATSFSGDGSGLTNLPLNLSLSVTTRTGITTVSVVAGFFTAFGRTSNTSISVTV